MRLLLFFMAGSLTAQQVVAPTPAPVGPTRGDNIEGYNVVNSFELGYRFQSVGGSLGKYRSDVNYGNGVRLLGSRLAINSREGHGWLFDELLLNTQGLGNDPYQTASLRLRKNKLYQYDLLWRLNDYYNPGLTAAAGQHLRDTTRRMQDHDLTLFPESNLRFFLGYSRNNQDGPALSTVRLFDGRGDEFPLFSNIRRLYNEYRVGGEVRALGFRLQAIRVWENFKEDSTDGPVVNPAGNNPADPTIVTQFARAEPYHGNTPSWRLALFRDTDRWMAVNARFTYSGGQRDFVLDELAMGQGSFGTAQNRQLVVVGDGRRPVTTANLTFSVFPTSSVTVTNHTAFHSIRMEGNSFFRQFDTGQLSDSETDFQFLGIRSFTNATDVNIRPRKWIGFFAGYRYTNRRFRSIEQVSFGESVDRLPSEQESNLNAVTAGMRITPVKHLTVIVDSELGRADRPFYSTSERNYHALGGRIQYKRGSLLLSAQSKTLYNTNSVTLSYHTFRSRNNSFDASWTPTPWLSFDAGYAKVHLDTLTAIAYYFDNSLISGDRSLYISNIHTATLGARLAIGKRADLYVGYTRVQDVGDGRPNNSASPSVPEFLAQAQVFPLAFESPLARLSIPLHSRLRFNIGYQYYRYREDFFDVQNYRAHTGFTSLSWSF